MEEKKPPFSWKAYSGGLLTGIMLAPITTIGGLYLAITIEKAFKDSEKKEHPVPVTSQVDGVTEVKGKHNVPIVLTDKANSECVVNFTSIYPEAQIIDSEKKLEQFVTEKSLGKKDLLTMYVTEGTNKRYDCVELTDTCVEFKEFREKFSFLKKEGIAGTFVFDQPYSWKLPHEFIEHGFHGIALSPGDKDYASSCQRFSKPFWSAVDNQMDLNNDGTGSPSESFILAMRTYNKGLEKHGTGTYRVSLPEITDLTIDEIANAQEPMIIEIGTTTCPPCKDLQRNLNTFQASNFHAFPVYLVTTDTNEHSDAILERLGVNSEGPVPKLVFRNKGENKHVHTGCKDVEELLVFSQVYFGK